MIPHLSERALILAPHGRDAQIAAIMLQEAGVRSAICTSLAHLEREMTAGAGFALLTEEALTTTDLNPLAHWLRSQPEWSDFPFVLLTLRGGGLERNPAAKRYLEMLGNVTFLERPFHPTTMVSLAQSALRGRRRQYEARARLEDLRRSERKYRSLFDSIEAGFCIVELLFDDGGAPVDYRFLEVNQAFERQSGLVGVQGRRMRDVAPDHEQYWFDLYGAVAKTGEPIRFENRATALGDSWYDVYAFRAGEPDDNQVAILFNNISERRQMEAALRESEEHYRNAAELNPQVSWTATPDGQLDRVVERWRAWTGISGTGDSWIEGLYAPDRERTLEAWRQALDSGTPFDIEHRVAHLKSGPRWARTRAYPRFGADGAIVKWYGSTEDIHERVQSQERLRRLNETLEQRVAERTQELEQTQDALRQSQKLESMGQLTGGVAHDFNNLLTPIVGSLDLLHRKGVGTERERRLIEGALQSADRARVLVQRLLAFARRQPLQPTAINIGELIIGMTDLIASTSGPRVRVELQVEDDLPPARADANQIEMALLNLTVNARDAMAEGGLLTVSARREKVRTEHPANLQPGDYIHLAVSDTGSGMDKATAAKAIEPFFTTKGVGRGTGLGLSMAHGLAAQLGGGLSIDSAPGAGATINLWLPLSEDPTASAMISDIPPAQRSSGNVLVVDDEDLVRASTVHMLSELGYDVVEAASAEEALALLDGSAQANRFDLLVTDHLMPGLTGTDLAHRVRVLCPHMRVLVISGYAEAGGIAADLPRLSKPFRQTDLAASLAAL